ncbi:MAG TPA: linear amide C-N hydrolase [Candidatus Bathyarchaeia archaeon]|nr:linear amide C-N hydrolase [Candidatus Bathyarchaeia archaeon]
MNKKKLFALGAALVSTLVFAASRPGDACSTFLLRDGKQILYGRNFDFFMSGGCVMTNQRNVTKVALLGRARNPARWTSRYGSVTFNQVSREWPYGGMNEAGLVVEIMWLSDAKYPAPDGRAAIPELQWVQYELDNCATVEEVLATDKTVRIEPSGHPIHFFVVDQGGNAAAIEFIDGSLVVHTGADLVVPALTNDTYDRSMEYLALHVGFGGTKRISRTRESLDRFATIASMLKDRRAVRRGGAMGRVFAILGEVAQGDGTVWSIVYDPKDLRVTFKSVGNKDKRFVRMADFDFDCKVPGRVLDVDAPGKGHVAGLFTEYTTGLNGAMVKRTFAKYREAKFMDLSGAAQEYLAGYPATLQCGAGAEK